MQHTLVVVAWHALQASLAPPNWLQPLQAAAAQPARLNFKRLKHQLHSADLHQHHVRGSCTWCKLRAQVVARHLTLAGLPCACRASSGATGNITLLSTGDGQTLIGVFASPLQSPSYVVLAQLYFIYNGECRMVGGWRWW